MADEGSQLLMAELILEEKELQAKLAAVDAKLAQPLERLARARELVLKAKTAYEQALETVKPLKSERTLIEGDLELVADKKRAARAEARRIEVGGVRPGTQEFVEQMNALAGDAAEFELRRDTTAAAVDSELAALKAKLAGG